MVDYLGVVKRRPADALSSGASYCFTLQSYDKNKANLPTFPTLVTRIMMMSA